MTLAQVIALLVGLLGAPADKPLPPNENPYTTDDSWDCYTLAEPDGRPVEYVCVTEHNPCHYKHSAAECRHELRWKVKRKP